MEENTKPLTVSEFALAKNATVDAIIDAIENRRIIPVEVGLGWYQCTIHPTWLETFEIELISVEEYAERKGVSFQGAYKKMRSGKLPFFVDPENGLQKIDWVQTKDIYFKPNTLQYRTKKTA